MPKVKEGSGSDEMTDYSEEEDPTFDETNLKKPIMEKVERQMPERKSGRKQKRPSFFQEFEEEEDNLDKILDDFELEQIEEAKNPDAKPKPKPPKNPGSRPRKRKEPSPTPDEDAEIELETSRSGRVRKKTKFYDYFNKEGGEEGVSGSDEEEDDDFNPEVEEMDEEPEEEYDPKSASESEGEGEGGAGGDLALPPKKRKARPLIKKDVDSIEKERNVNDAKLSHEKSEDELGEEEEKKESKQKEESETTKEAKEHGLSDEKEAMAAMALPLEALEEVGTEKATDAEKESTKTTLDDVSLQTPRPEAPSESKEEASTEDENAGGVDDNAGDLDGSVTEENPNDENPLADNEEAILTSATEKMEEGDEQYKNELAESQMDNIFN